VSEPVDVSVSIVTYNSREEIGRCLEAVKLATDGLAAEVFVVDNNSTDGTADLVERDHPWVTLIRTGVNAGYGRANNLAIARARGRWILVLNPDTAPAPDAITALLAVGEADPSVGAVGPRLVNADGSLQHSVFRFPDTRQAFYGFFELVPLDSQDNGRMPLDAYEEPMRAQHLKGACVLLRREAIDQVGAFDPGYFMYFEETDLCRRLAKGGWTNLYTPTATVVHAGEASTGTVREWMSVEFHRSQARYYRLHNGLFGYATLKLIVWPGTAYRFARSFRAVLRRRITPALFAERCVGYFRILWF
jgi:hypothetical protein